jgi:hypothetical protein
MHVVILLVSHQMSSHEITFNPNLSEAPRTRADFIYKMSPIVFYIIDTGLGLRPVTYDIDALLRKIEHWHQGSHRCVQEHVSR